MEFGIPLLTLLFFTSLLAGFIDSIAGGGGLITLPVLLAVGVPPQMALGTNKLQGTFGVCTAAANFIRKGKVNLKECGVGIVSTMVGAGSGAYLIQRLDPELISRFIPYLLLFVFIYTVASKNLGVEDQKPRLPRLPFYILFGLMMGMYDGMFGPGTGSFWTAGLMILLGLNITKAVGVTKVMNFSSNIVALILFALAGNVVFSLGLTMAAGQVIGARVGSNLAIKKGAGFIRPLFLGIVLLTIARLIYQNYA